MDNGPLFELHRARMTALLNELSDRPEARGIAASLYLVGGAAMTLAYGREGLTTDIDALTSHAAVFDQAKAMAQDHGLPEAASVPKGLRAGASLTRFVGYTAIDGVTGELFQARLTPAHDHIRGWLMDLPGPVAVT